VKPWVSARDIDKGRRWIEEINTQLEEGRFGIACLDRTNLKSEWIHWEPGALAAKAKETPIWTYLIDIHYSEVQYPLAQFQHTKATQQDTLKLLQTIN